MNAGSARIFPNTAACLRLVRALAVGMHENWIEATKYLNMEYRERTAFLKNAAKAGRCLTWR